MTTIRTQFVTPETADTLDVWRTHQEPKLSRPQAVAAILRLYFQEHEKEIRKFRAEIKDARPE